MSLYNHFFSWSTAFDHAATRWMVGTVVFLLVFAPILILVLGRSHQVSTSRFDELWKRWQSWVVLSIFLIGPLLLGRAPTVIGITLLSLFCFREYARATGLIKEQLLMFFVTLGIFFLCFAVLDHWYHFFLALVPLGCIAISIAGIMPDRPEGFIQRVALAIFGFIFFGLSFAHLAYFANDRIYRPIVLLLLFAVSMNDIFAYVCGSLFGKRKLAPNTSPNKTLGGALGSLVLTMGFVAGIGKLIFEGTRLDSLGLLLILGMIISIVGMLGDLLMSSIKRDLGIKDIGHTIPGHGGLLDRFDSLILVSPAVYHFVHYYIGVGAGIGERILSAPFS